MWENKKLNKEVNERRDFTRKQFIFILEVREKINKKRFLH